MSAAPRATQATPGATTGRRPRGEATRTRLLEIVLEILAEQGPRAVTHRAVAQRAGVSLGTATYYFSSRRSLLVEAFGLHRRRGAARHEALECAPAEQGDVSGAIPPGGLRQADRLTAILEHAITEERADLLASIELTLELARDDGLRAEMGASSEALYEPLLREAGSDRPGDDAALVAAAVRGLALEWLSSPQDPAHEQRVRRRLRRLFERLVGSESDSPDSPDSGGASIS